MREVPNQATPKKGDVEGGVPVQGSLDRFRPEPEQGYVLVQVLRKTL